VFQLNDISEAENKYKIELSANIPASSRILNLCPHSGQRPITLSAIVNVFSILNIDFSKVCENILV
jgi:hypothetical protein